MNSNYETWLQMEKEWIAIYCRKMKKRLFCITIPAITVLMAVIIGVVAVIGGNTIQDSLESAAAGGIFGLAISFWVALFTLLNLRPSKYGKKIEKSVKKLGLSESEKDELATEMLEAYAREEKVISYQFSTPGQGNSTPARFVLTPHYCFLEGSLPYSILVRLSDIRRIRLDEQERVCTKRGSKTKTTYYYTFYCINFYKNDGEKTPYEVMGFIEPDLRTRVLRLLEEAGISPEGEA